MRIIHVLLTAITLSTLTGCATESAVTRHADTAVRAEPRRISDASRSSVNEPIVAPSRSPRVIRF